MIHRMDNFFASSDFTRRSADHSMGPFPFFICTLHILHSLHCFHFSSFGFQLFFVNHFFSVFTFELSFFKKTQNRRQTSKQTSKLIAPYRENYVHRILFFFVRNSFESNDQGPAGRIQMDRLRPVQKYGLFTSNNQLG